jgi:hypothetical protein
MDKYMPAKKFKSQCSPNSSNKLFGKMAGTIHIKGNILLSINDAWNKQKLTQTGLQTKT